MGDTSGTIEKVTRNDIAMELFRRSWELRTYVSQLEADKAALEAKIERLTNENANLVGIYKTEGWDECISIPLEPTEKVLQILYPDLTDNFRRIYAIPRYKKLIAQQQGVGSDG